MPEATLQDLQADGARIVLRSPITEQDPATGAEVTKVRELQVTLPLLVEAIRERLKAEPTP